MSSILGTPWKIAAVVAGLLNLVIGFFLVTSNIENRAIAGQRDALQRSITDPRTGYVARLTQAQNNVAELTETIERQNAAYRSLSAESAAQLETTRELLVAAKRESAAWQRRINSFVAHDIEGETLEDRIRDVDERAMKEFLGDE